MPRLTHVLALAAGAATTLASCAPAPRCAPALASAPPAPAFAVVLSDYASSAVALADARGEIVEPAWVTSGTRAPRLVTPVSGDVVLPQAPLGRGVLAWIDRYSVDVLTLVALERGEVVLQADLRGDREGARTGFSPNPQDAVRLADGRILVSRLNPNPDPAAPEIARGNDLAVLDPASGAIARVALGCDATSGAATYFARPAELAVLRTGDRAVVLAALARLDADFDGVGPGAIAVLDAETLAPRGCLELAPLENCSTITSEPDAPARAIVLCTGPTFAGVAARRAHAGLVELELGDDLAVTERARLLPAAEAPAPTGWLVATGSGRGVFVSDPRGDDPRPDRLVAFDLETGAATVVAEGAAFALGLGAAAGDLVLVPDADRRALLRFDLGDGVPTLRDEVPIHGCADLPPRQVAPLAAD